MEYPKINCLNKGFVRLIDHMGNDLSVIRNARNSYDAAWRTGEDGESDDKLLRYLLKNSHSTPFESVTFTFEVYAPIFVLRQWHRHRTWSYNAISARYKELPCDYYIPDPYMIGIQGKDNKQVRTILAPERCDEIIDQLDEDITKYRDACEAGIATYKTLLANGWPRELARCTLPVSTYSNMFATVNLWNFIRFLKLRIHPHAQYEIRVYAEALADLARLIVPKTMALITPDILEAMKGPKV